MRAREFMRQRFAYLGRDFGITNRTRKDVAAAPRHMQSMPQTVARQADQESGRKKGSASDLLGRR